MNRWIVLLLGLIVLGSGLLVYSRQRTPTPTPSVAAVAASPEEVAQEVRKLKRELARIKANTPSVVTVIERGSHAPIDGEAQTELQPVADDQTEQSPEERSQAVATALDVRIASEPRDASWSAATNRQIREVMANNAPSAQIVDVECATSMCKVVLEHGEDSRQADTALAIQATPPFSNGVYYHYDSDLERPHTTMYVLREGRSFREGEATRSF